MGSISDFEMPPLVENDVNVEKAEACAKELDDVSALYIQNWFVLFSSWIQKCFRVSFFLSHWMREKDTKNDLLSSDKEK